MPVTDRYTKECIYTCNGVLYEQFCQNIFLEENTCYREFSHYGLQEEGVPSYKGEGELKMIFHISVDFWIMIPTEHILQFTEKKIFMNHFTSKNSNGNNEVIGWVIFFILCFLLASSFEHSVWQLWKSEFLLENLLLGNISVLLDFLKRCVI